MPLTGTSGQLGLTFRTPVSVTPSSSLSTTVHPATNVLGVTKWRRTWRAATAADGAYLDFDFGSAMPLEGVFLNNCNATLIMLARSSDGVAWTNLYAANVALPLDERCEPPKRRKGWFPADEFTSAFNHRYLRLLLYTVQTPSPGWFEVGAVAFPVAEAMTRNFGAPLVHIPTEGISRLDYPDNGGSEVTVLGPTRVRFERQGGPFLAEAMPQLQRLRALGQGGPFFYYENRGDRSKGYILQRMADPTFAERVKTFDASWQFEECI